MPRDTLTGTRIREKRVAQGLKQSQLARQVGVSASYLNLIEHNRRRIGGKLLRAIADELDVEPALLTEGAGATLIAGLREAASEMPQATAELDRIDEFAGRFPGWAALSVALRGRVLQLERSVETLTDRMTHDPHLAASLHEVISTVTAIRSAAAILTDPGEIDAEWQARFHRNIHEESERLAETSRGLVTYLEADNASATETGTPQEELDTVLAAADHHVPELERDPEDAERPESAAQAVAATLGHGMSRSGRALLRQWLARYRRDVEAVPLETMRQAISQHGTAPIALACALEVPPDTIMRRLAAMPREVLPEPVGLAICDGAGVMTYRKPLPDFPMPRFGAACPLWPLFKALNRPFVVQAMLCSPAGRAGGTVRAEAVAMPVGPPALDTDPIYEAHMLVRAVPLGGPERSAEIVGVACRICPRSDCRGRREPSILSRGR